MRHGDAGDRGAVALGHELSSSAPSAADVQDAHPGLRADLACDKIELGLLSVVQVVSVLVIRTAVDHPRIEHELIQIVAEVVMLLPYDISAARVLFVEQSGAQSQFHGARGTQVLLYVASEYAREHLIQLVAVPPAVRISLAGPQRAMAKNTLEESLVVNADVPGA